MSDQKRRSVQPEWCLDLPIQQQSVLFLAARGPDGVAKFHPCKAVVRAYRGTVLVAAWHGRLLRLGESADTFMDLSRFADMTLWNEDMEAYFANVDSLPHHYQMHLMHGAQIVGYHHPDERFRSRWATFYTRAVDDLHLRAEPPDEMDDRLNDWGREHWEMEPWA